MQKVTIERKRDLSPEEFARDHLYGAGAPVIVVDAMTCWPALSKWSFDFFKEAFGSDFVTAAHGLDSSEVKLTKLATYFEYLDEPAGELAGFWVSSKDNRPLRQGPVAASTPFYLLGWNAFEKHPELFDDIGPPPSFLDDLTVALRPHVRDIFQLASSREYWSVYVGPEGSLSKLHCDFWSTHAYLAQVRGKKKAVLFSPSDEPLLYEGRVDPERPDLVRFPRFDGATAYECVLEPGEMLFIPANWWHHVRALEKSITVSHNFFNHTNMNEHMVGLFRKLPDLLAVLERSPGWRDELLASPPTNTDIGSA